MRLKVLFVCNLGQNRSRTAARLFEDMYDTRYAGIFSEKDPVTRELLAWADVVCVMEADQRRWIGERFPREYLQKSIIDLDIPDVYRFDQPELIDEIKKRISLLKK